MKKIVICCLLLLATLQASAGPVDRQTAQSIAKSFFQKRGIEMEVSRNVYRAPKVGMETEESAFYVFNAGSEKGFVVVSGDDRTEQILGYAEKGTFDEATLPPNVKSWLQHYADEMKYLEENRRYVGTKYGEESTPAKGMRKNSITRHSVPQLMTTTWNQGSPYNDKCPIYYNGDGSTGRSATGCVATALAQVINFYKYPEKTKRRIPAHSNTYYLDNGTSETVSLSAIKMGTVIDWANMKDNYTGGETQEEKDAVANLMLMCGQAVKMGYGASSGAAFGDNVAEMYNKYFDFDDKAYAASRDKYTADEWFDLIYKELEGGHPIPLAGYSSGGGHSFVIDGFDGDKLFHLNWGWGGMCDGYFLVSILNPDDTSGIGASNSSDGYSMGQCIIVGLDFPDEEKAESHTSMTINDTRVEGTSVNSNYINWTGSTNSFKGAIVMEDENGVLVPVSDVYDATNLGANYLYNWSFDLNGKIKTPGTYKLTPASRLASNTIWRPAFNTNMEYIEVIVGSDKTTKSVSLHSPVESLEAINWEFPGSCKNGEEQEVKVTLKNNGDEYYREVRLFVGKTTSKEDSQSRGAVTVKPGETVTSSFFFTPSSTGKWNVYLCTGGDGSGEIAKSSVQITSTGKTNSENLSVNSFSISNNAYGPCLTGTISVKNNASADFNGKIKLTLWSYADGYCWGSGSTTTSIVAAAGGSGTGSFSFENLNIGTTYFITANYTSKDAELDNGGLIWDHSWEIKSGYLYWNASGTVSGTGVANTVTVASTTAGMLFDGVNVTTIKPGTNKNAIYAFKNGAKVAAGLDGYNVVLNGEAEEINIADTKSMYCPVEFNAKKATFSHTFALTGNGRSGWEPLTLPFQPSRITINGEEVTWKNNGEEGDFWLREFSEITDNNEVVFTDVKDMASIRTNTPYIISIPKRLAGATIVFEGENVHFANTSTDPMIVSSNAFHCYGQTLSTRVSNAYVMNAAGDAYEFSSTSKTSKPFDNYFTWILEKEHPTIIPIRLDSVIIGDVDDDGKLDENDVQAMAKHIADNDVDTFNSEAADLNNDGKITVIDIVNFINQTNK